MAMIQILLCCHKKRSCEKKWWGVTKQNLHEAEKYLAYFLYGSVASLPSPSSNIEAWPNGTLLLHLGQHSRLEEIEKLFFERTSFRSANQMVEHIIQCYVIFGLVNIQLRGKPPKKKIHYIEFIIHRLQWLKFLSIQNQVLSPKFVETSGTVFYGFP